MNSKRPIKSTVVKRIPDVRKQLLAAQDKREKQKRDKAQFIQDQFNKGDEKVEKLKGQIVTSKRTNNTTRIGALAAVAAGTLATNLIILQGSETTTDNILRYAIVIGGCVAGVLMNGHFNKTDITMTEMLKRANAWSRQEFTPEEIQTFKDLYDQVNKDFEGNPELRKNVKSSFIFQTSQGVIFVLALAAIASAADKFDFNIINSIFGNTDDDGNTLIIDPNDPMLNSGEGLSFPKFD
jgi:hypothetical protein